MLAGGSEATYHYYHYRVYLIHSWVIATFVGPLVPQMISRSTILIYPIQCVLQHIPIKIYLKPPYPHMCSGYNGL